MVDKRAYLTTTPPRVSASGERVDLWCAFHDQVQDERLVAAYREMLTDAERAQELKFYFERDQRRYLVTRALVRSVLSRYLDIAPQDWRFATNEYGRPEIANEAVRSAGLSFNVTHAGELIVLGITHGRHLGIDTESLVRSASVDIADRFFAPAEAASLRRQPPQAQQRRFFEYWTLKESYIKARGMGLSIPLDKFRFLLDTPEDVAFEVEPDLQDSAARWEFWQLQVRDEYLLSVCAERVFGPTQLSLTEIVPLVREAALPLNCVRRQQRPFP